MRIVQTALLAATVLLASIAAHAVDERASPSRPVAAIADHQLQVVTAKGKGVLPLYVSRDWSKPQPDVTRALLVFHGRLRDADNYNAAGQRAVAAAGLEGKTTILITPQFLSQADVEAFHLSTNILRWAPEAWMGGDDAIAPAPISSFSAIDAILNHLADRTIFPNLKEVVLAGHSGGGQVMQRYAVVGRGESALVKAGVHVRYVVANPSSYVYFSDERPTANGGFAPYHSLLCSSFNKWKYGILDPPPYIGDTSFTNQEAAYAKRDVIYLLGQDDTDPQHPALDKSCSAEAEGPYRLARGTSYFRYMQARHPEGMTQQLWTVPGVGHDGDRMFNSSCGVAAIFSIGSCKTKVQ